MLKCVSTVLYIIKLRCSQLGELSLEFLSLFLYVSSKLRRLEKDYPKSSVCDGNRLMIEVDKGTIFTT